MSFLSSLKKLFGQKPEAPQGPLPTLPPVVTATPSDKFIADIEQLRQEIARWKEAAENSKVLLDAALAKPGPTAKPSVDVAALEARHLEELKAQDLTIAKLQARNNYLETAQVPQNAEAQAPVAQWKTEKKWPDGYVVKVLENQKYLDIYDKRNGKRYFLSTGVFETLDLNAKGSQAALLAASEFCLSSVGEADKKSVKLDKLIHDHLIYRG